MKKLLGFIICIMGSVTFAKNIYHITGVNTDIKRNVAAHVTETSSITTLKQNIKKALEPYGYFSPDILIKKSNNQYQIRIDKGKPIRILHIETKIIGAGSNDTALKEFFQNLPLKEGDIFNSVKYENVKEKALLLANQQGYIKAKFIISKALINLGNNKVIIILNLKTGNRFYIGKIKVNSKTYNEEFIRRMFSIKEGEPFSSEKLLNLQQDLLLSPYFDQALAIPDMNAVEDERIPINLHLNSPKAKHYSIGVGYSTLMGPRIRAATTLKHLTRDGHSFDAQLKLSQVLSGIAFKYHIPSTNPLTDEWLLGADAEYFKPEHGLSRSATLQAGYKKQFSNLQTKYFINYLIENYKIKHHESQMSHLLYPSLSLDYIKVDDPINTQDGLGFNFQLKGASTALLSSTNFLQVLINAKYLFTMNDLQFLLKSGLGLTAVDRINHLPLSMFFFAGGGNSIRGYKESEIGPGTFLEIGSLEARYHIKGNWTSALFLDAGTASNHFPGKIYKSVGLGLIYASPMGPIRLYAAHPLNKGSRSFSLEFNIGPEF